MKNGTRLAAVDLGSNSFRLEIGQLDHGQIHRTEYLKETVRLGIRKLEIMQMVLGRPSVVDKETVKLIRRLTKELLGYLNYNRDSLPNYGQRYRAGKRISSSFIESAVNQLIDKRMSKSQQMRWDPVSAHLLLQVRVRVVDGMLRDDFARWYEGFPANTSTFAKMA